MPVLKLFPVLLGITLIFSWATKVFASDDFCGADDKPALIYSKMPVTSAGNLQDYLATNGLSRVGTVNDILTLSPSLGTGNDANLEQIADFLFSLNDFHSYMMSSSSEGIGQLVSERLMGEINNLYFLTQTNNRRIKFSNSMQEVIKGDGYTASGTYSFVTDNQISISLKITRLSDAESRTFVSAGEPIDAVKRLAKRVFTAFQLPSNQSVFNPFHDKTWVSVGASLTGELMRLNDAEEYCSLLNARLPSKIELSLANKLGAFVSGVKIDINGTYVVTDDGSLTVLEPSTGSCPVSLNESSRQYLVICIRD